MPLAIGIDLGTVYSCFGVYRNGNIEIIANDQGNRVTPSCVAFTKDGRLVGDSARNQIELNPENTIIDAKRLIGQKFEDISEYDLKRWPFEVINEIGSPKFEVTFKNEKERFNPEQISAAVLSKIRQTAEFYLNEPIKDAVITVPAHFKDSQRQATKDAAEIAGFNVLQLINEPTAAAIAYGLNQGITSDQNILVYDMGGGTFDVSILAINGDVYEVKAVGGDPHLGGEDFNNKMLDYFIDEIKEEHNKDITDDKVAISRLLRECEKSKIALSTSIVSRIQVNSLIEGIDFNSSISRACFEHLNADFFDKAINIVEKTLTDSKLTKDDIHEVILVGGSTYIPKVQKMLQDFFNGKKLNKSVKPDEAVAYGAAVYASILNGDDLDDFELVLLDVTPFSLGIEILGERMSKVIKCNTPIPIKKTKRYVTIFDNQQIVDIDVFEGESKTSTENKLLGKFKIVGIPPQPAGVPKIDVTFEINVDGILKVSAVEKSGGDQNAITIDEYRNRLSREEVNQNKELERYVSMN